MKAICAWCGKYLEEVPPYDDPTPTHGIFPECAKRVDAEFQAYRAEVARQEREAHR